MVKIKVIEFFLSSSRGEEHIRRKQRWQAWQTAWRSSTVRIEIVESAIDDNGQKPGGKMIGLDGKPFSCDDCDLLLVHESDADAYIDIAIVKGKPVTCYGGANPFPKFDRIQRLIIDFLPWNMLEINMDRFLSRIAKEGKISRESFYSLLGYIPRLEASLALLDHCLCSEGCMELLTDFPFPHLRDDIQDILETPLEALVAAEATGFPASNTIAGLIEQLDQMGNREPVRYQKVLCQIRDYLLDKPKDLSVEQQ